MASNDNIDSQEPPQTFTLLTDNTNDSLSLEGYTFDMSAPCRRVVYHPLKDCGYKPEPNSEIYAYGLPSDTTDSELMEFFQQCGEIFKLKVMVGSGNANRGFCFVTFMNSEVAKSSLCLNYVPFRPDYHLHITVSYNNRRIFLGNIPVCKSRDEVWKELMKNGVTKITDVIMYRGYADRSQNRGFVFVEFEGHEQAAGFRAQYEGQLRLWDKPIIIDWSVPLPIVDNSVIDKVTTIFMRNLPVTLSKEELQELIFKLMDKEYIQRVYKFKNYAFVHLCTRTHAEHLMKILTEHFKDELIEIEWAKPPSKHTSPSYRSRKVLNSLRAQRHNSTSSNSSGEDSRSNAGLTLNSLSPIQALRNTDEMNYPQNVDKSPSPTTPPTLSYNKQQYFDPMLLQESRKTEKHLNFLGNDYKWYNQPTPSTHRDQVTSVMSRNLTLSPSASSSLGKQEDDTRHTNSPAMKNEASSNGVELPSAGYLSRDSFRHRHGESYLNSALFTTSRTPNDFTISTPQFSRYNWSTKYKDVAKKAILPANALNSNGTRRQLFNVSHARSNVEPQISRSSMERFYGNTPEELSNFTLNSANLNYDAITTYQQAMEEHYGNGSVSNFTVNRASSSLGPITAYRQAMQKLYENGNKKVSNISEDQINCCKLCSNSNKLLP